MLQGSDPYAAFDVWNGRTWHFAAPPTAAQLYVPFAWLPQSLGLWIAIVAGVALCAMALRRLGLPLWWLLFPPLTEGLAAANPQLLMFGLLFAGGAAGRALASGLKIYALVPIVARREWRGLLASGALFALSFVLGLDLWQRYVTGFGAISARLLAESEGGVSAARVLETAGPSLGASPDLQALIVLLLLAAIGGLLLLVAVRDVAAAGWLGVAFLWPGAEYHLGTFAIPVARRAGIWVLAIPTVPTYLLGLVLLAYGVVAGRQAMADAPVQGLSDWFRSASRSLVEAGRRRAPVP